MNAALIALLAVPTATGLLGLVLGRRVAGPLAVLGTLVAFVLAVLLAFEVDPSSRASAVDVNETWIPALGISFHLAIDGLNAALIVMTTFVWAAGTWWGLRDRELSTPSYLLLLGIGESAVLGAFLAQDLMLFVLCFDLMLLPFVLITARTATHGESGLAPVLKLLVYTLVGSLLMLVAAIALAILSAETQGAPVTFDLATLAATTLDTGTQKWILAAFLAAFLIKMPVVPLHGWMPDTYRAMPLPALAIFSAVLAKVAVYGLLKIALPILPDAVVDWRLVMVVFALIGIIYGSLVALTSTEPRLVLGYSSVAQLGFILLGVSSLDPAGAQGAILQSITHALVVLPAFVLVAVISERARGSQELVGLGGLARRAPVLAATFLVVALCWLALPGTGNFVGEYLNLLGQWRVAPWATIVGSIGIALAAVYVLRMFITMMQNDDGADVPADAPEVSRRDATMLGIAVGALVLISLVPQLALRPSDTATRSVVEPSRALFESKRKAEQTIVEAATPGDEATLPAGGATDDQGPITR